MRTSMLPRLIAAAAVCLTAATAPVAHADGTPARYAASGTAVVRTQDGTVADNGAVVCDAGDGVGAGGLCLPFGGGDAVHVVDAEQGENVAFQVCLDNNGDGFCTFNDPDPVCPDVIRFSHGDDGTFHNPVGPVQTGFTAGCPGGPWRGYVVLLCQGAHTVGTPHAHPATTGTGVVTTGGEGSGDFCGGPSFSAKPYRVTGGGNLTCGMLASTDPSSEPGTLVGFVHAGPWHHAAGTVSIKCTVVINRSPVEALSVTTGQQPAAAYLPLTTVAFQAGAADDVALCTWLSFDGGPYRLWDAGGEGDCALAVAVSHDDYRSLHVPQSLG